MCSATCAKLWPTKTASLRFGVGDLVIVSCENEESDKEGCSSLWEKRMGYIVPMSDQVGQYEASMSLWPDVDRRDDPNRGKGVGHLNGQTASPLIRKNPFTWMHLA